MVDEVLKAKYGDLSDYDDSVETEQAFKARQASVENEVRNIKNGMNNAVTLQAAYKVAFHDLGGVEFLKTFGEKEPEKFLKLLMSAFTMSSISMENESPESKQRDEAKTAGQQILSNFTNRT